MKQQRESGRARERERPGHVSAWSEPNVFPSGFSQPKMDCFRLHPASHVRHLKTRTVIADRCLFRVSRRHHLNFKHCTIEPNHGSKPETRHRGTEADQTVLLSLLHNTCRGAMTVLVLSVDTAHMKTTAHYLSPPASKIYRILSSSAGPCGGTATYPREKQASHRFAPAGIPARYQEPSLVHTMFVYLTS